MNRAPFAPILVVVASVGLLAGLTVGNTYHPAPAPAAAPTAHAAPTPAAVGTAVLINGTNYVPCATEDYEGPEPCFWDAGARGNGKGESFLWTGSERKVTSRAQ